MSDTTNDLLADALLIVNTAPAGERVKPGAVQLDSGEVLLRRATPVNRALLLGHDDAPPRP
jgi:hypothetical protein